MHKLQVSDTLKDALIDSAIDASRSALASLPDAAEVTMVVQGLFEALAVGPSQSDKQILVALRKLAQGEELFSCWSALPSDRQLSPSPAWIVAHCW